MPYPATLETFASLAPGDRVMGHWRGGQADIHYAPIDDPSRAVNVSDHPADDWSPSLAFGPEGRPAERVRLRAAHRPEMSWRLPMMAPRGTEGASSPSAATTRRSNDMSAMGPL